MDRLRGLFGKRGNELEYAPLTENEPSEEGDTVVYEEETGIPFSWVEYGVFALIGVAMLWAWNMFLAAAPYFQGRFASSEWISDNFQSLILSISTIANLGSMVILSNIQSKASYPFRINAALFINTTAFLLLTLSTILFLGVSPTIYLMFLLVVVGCAAWATGMIQNGAFAFASTFGRHEYMQGIMVGQALAGVLPSLVQVISVLAAPEKEDVSRETPGGSIEPGKAAFIYFLAAVIVSVVAILAFSTLVRRHTRMMENRLADSMAASHASVDEAERAARKVISMAQLFKKLHWLAAAIFMTFAVAMFFPVFTPKILSVTPVDQASQLLKPAVFIPLGFFFWNLGDFCGRSASIYLPLRDRPALLFAASIARILFLPMYALCNLHGKGAIISSDLFYLLLVQFPFGFSGGWVCSNCMMAAADYVDEGEKEASGSFMGLCLVSGLAFGSVLSFTAAGI